MTPSRTARKPTPSPTVTTCGTGGPTPPAPASRPAPPSSSSSPAGTKTTSQAASSNATSRQGGKSSTSPPKPTTAPKPGKQTRSGENPVNSWCPPVAAPNVNGNAAKQPPAFEPGPASTKGTHPPKPVACSQRNGHATTSPCGSNATTGPA